MAEEPPIAATGPCAGHVCDNCAVCRRGRCCRRDQPAYQLPALGDWKEPIHGQFGVLATDGEKVQCHICGRWYRSLATHARLVHDLYADEYKALFGLNVTTGLLGDATRALKADIARQAFREYWTGETGRTTTAEQRARYQRGRPQRQEARLHAEPKERQQERARRRYEQGLWTPRGFPAGAAAQGHEAHRQRLQDPEYRAAYSKKMSEAKGGRVQTTCAICGTPFEALRHRLQRGQDKVCGKRECASEVRRRALQTHNPYWQSAEYREKAAWLSVLPPAVFDVLPEGERELVQRHFGLEGGRPWTYAELAMRVRLSRWQVQRRITEALATLLGAAGGGAGIQGDGAARF